MKTVLIKALVLEHQEGSIRVMLDDGFGQYVHQISPEKAIPLERLEGERKPDHVRIQKKGGNHNV